MTQAQFARWLGVSIKQVKYLEHQRRNPSGPTRRLLDILAGQAHFNGTDTVVVLGADMASLKPPSDQQKPSSGSSGFSALSRPGENGNGSRKIPAPSTAPAAETKGESLPPEIFPSTPNDDAFVWQ
ncbi:MAG TPA: hypothetical protein VMP11_16870 [Verrucomicrobiae bacterium]|nr:hypothetical protein [Verrucomicrobiae bacterium]